MELEGLNKDRLPQDAAAEQPWMASFARLDLNLPVAWPKQALYLKRNVRGMS